MRRGRRPALLACAAAATAALLSACGGTQTGVSTVPAGRRVLVALPLTVRAGGLAELADGAADPAGKAFGHFRPVHSIAARYGAPAPVIAADLGRLRTLGMDLRVDPSHGALWGTVSAAQARRWFGTGLVEEGGVVEPSEAPRVPPGLTGVTGVVGLTAGGPAAAAPQAGESPSPDCPATPLSRHSLAQQFGFSDLLRARRTGTGRTIDILAVHDWQPAVLANFNRCSGLALRTRMRQDRVPLTPQLSGGPEIALDGLVLTLLAPDARLGVTDYDAHSALAFPLIELLASRPATPDVLDITVDYCEAELTRPEQKLSEWLLAVLAGTGTTTVSAAGDLGSSGCRPATDEPRTTYPAASRFVTGVGGLDFAGGARDPAYLQPWDEPGRSGGGGGVGAHVPAPPWQPGPRRRVPDLAAYADPGGAGAIPVCADPGRCRWIGAGGTSLAATALSAVAAMIARPGGHDRWGNLAARLWREGPHDSGLRDVVQGANTTFTRRCCEAKAGYDTASGWGLFIPDLLGASALRR